MAHPSPLPLDSLESALREKLGATSRRWVAVSLRVQKGASRRLLALKEADEAAYFVSGRAPDAAERLPQSTCTFVGLGALVSRRFEGARRLREAQTFIEETFSQLELPPELVRLVRFFGGASFSPGRDGSGRCWSDFGDARFVLPRCLYVDDETRADGSAELVCCASLSDLERTLDLAARILDECERTPDPPPRTLPARPSARQTESSEPEDRFARLVEGIKSEIDQGVVEKVVAARRITLELSAPPNPADILRHMNAHAPLCARFCLRVGEKTFVGATPERLVERRGPRLYTEALAGSISSRGPDAEARLLQSEKDRREHAFVVRAIREALSPICASFDAAETPEIRRLESILHLRTPIFATLPNPTHVLELVERMHPTPAVGGLPRERAVEFIVTHEAAERGWYAAPFGWVDANGDGEFVVALRSGLIAGNKVHLYAGAGIVRGSDSAAEYAETELKLAGMLNALGLDATEGLGAPLDQGAPSHNGSVGP